MDVKMNLPLLSALRASQAGGAAGVGAAGVGAAGRVAAQGGVQGAGKAGGPGFAASLDAALKSVSETQNEAGRMQRAFQSGVEGVTLEETMVAMQKAQIGFQATLTVRNRLVSAYSEIMNMQV